MFGSVLSYVSLRLLGFPPTDPAMTEARAFLHRNGGAVTGTMAEVGVVVVSVSVGVSVGVGVSVSGVSVSVGVSVSFSVSVSVKC